MRAEGVRFVQVEVPELDGGLRCKLLALDKGLSDGIGWSNIIYGLTTADDVYESPFSSYENGFADVFGTPDTCHGAAACPGGRTRRRWSDRRPRRRRHHDAGRPAHDAAPRRRQGRRHGLPAALRGRVRGRHLLRGRRRGSPPSPATLTPVSRTRNAYSLVRMPALRALFETFMQRMEEVGAPVVSMHTELGRGAVEFALAHAPPLAAADGAMRAKAYLKELCAERGMVATFMAKVDADMPGSGGHVHQSLWRDGENVFWDGSGCERDRGSTPPARSSICRRWHRALHGQHQLVPAPRLAALGAAQRILGRRQPERGAPAHHPAGAAAARASRTGCRAPMRTPISPSAACWPQGLDGIERGLAPPPLCSGNAALDESYTKLPATLADAVEAFAGSAFLRERLRRPLRRSLRALAPGRARSLARLAAEPGQRLGVRALFRDHLRQARPSAFSPRAFCHYIDRVGGAACPGLQRRRGTNDRIRRPSRSAWRRCVPNTSRWTRRSPRSQGRGRRPRDSGAQAPEAAPQGRDRAAGERKPTRKLIPLDRQRLSPPV